MWQNGVYLLNGNGEFSDKYSTMPTASIGLVGKIVQYTGTTTVNYTNGYFYKGIATNMPSVATIGIGESTGITEATLVKATFEGLITASGTYDFVFSASTATSDIGTSTGITASSVVVATFETLLTATGDYVFTFDGSDWKYDGSAVTLSDYGISVTGTPSENDTVTVSYVKADWKYDGDIVTLSDYGITAVGTPDDQDTISVVYAVAYVAYSWELINVQPATVVPDASNTVAGKIRIATDVEASAGTLENVGINPKQLETGLADVVPQVVAPFELQTDVLSGVAKLVTKNSSFFIYSNGDVSRDGKTVIKTNTLEEVSETTNIFCSENYLVTMMSRQNGASYVYSIDTDGTLTLVRTLTGGDFGRYDKGRSRYENGYFIIWGSGDTGYCLFTDTTIVAGEVSFETATSSTIITYSQGYWCAVSSVDNYIKLKKSADITTLMSATENTIYTQTGDDSGLELADAQNIDNLLTAMFDQNDNVFPVRVLQMDFSDDSVDTTLLPINSRVAYLYAHIGKTSTQYYITAWATTGNYWLANTLATFSASATGVGFGIATMGTTSVITLNADDILWSGNVDIAYTNLVTVDTVSDLVSTTATLDVAGNTIYKLGTLTALTLSTVETSDLESIIYFTTDSTITFTDNSGVRWGGGNEQPALEPNTVYCIAIRNGLAEIDNFGSAS